MYCTRKHCPQNPKHKSSTHQQQVGLEYDEVPATSGEERIELRKNIAYGPVWRIELREKENLYSTDALPYSQPQWNLFYITPDM